MYYKTPKKAESFFRPVTKAKKANGGVAQQTPKA
jgi:hypothetical protein